jgi:hypothetical protein
MRITLIVSIQLLLNLFPCAQSTGINWTRCLGGSDDEPITAYTAGYMQKTKDGGFIIISDTESSDGTVSNPIGINGNSNIWIIKLDPLGNTEWEACVGGASADYPVSITETSDSSFIVLGTTLSMELNGYHGQQDVLLSKINKNGIILFTKCYGGSGADLFNNYNKGIQGDIKKLIELPGEQYVLVFETLSIDGDVSSSSGSMDICLLHISQMGDIINSKTYGGSSYESAISISKSLDNSGFFILGMTNSNDGDLSYNHGGVDIALFKLDNSFNLLWSKCLGSIENDFSGTLLEEPNGNIFVSGRFKEYYSDVIIYKLDNVGNVIFSKVFGGSGDDTGNSSGYHFSYPLLYKCNSNEYIFTTLTNSTDGDISQNYGGFDIWIVKIDSNGTILWEKTFGGIGDQGYITNLIVNPNSEIVFGVNVGDNSGNLAHTNFHQFGFGFDIGIFKLNSLGNTLYYECYGGSDMELINNLLCNENNNEITFCGSTGSMDGDVIGNHGAYDIWIVNLNSTLAVNNLSPENNTKAVVKIIDLMGRVTEFKPNTVLIYVYSDGSTEKVFKVE